MILIELGIITAAVLYFLPWLPIKIMVSGFFLWTLTQWIYCQIISRGLRIIPLDPLLRTFAREKAWVRIRVENSSFLPLDIYWTDSTGELEIFGETRGILTLGPRKGTEISYQIRSLQRGLFSLGPALFRFRDPLGFFPSAVELTIERQLLVYPPWGDKFPMVPGVPGGLKKDPWGFEPDTSRIRDLRPFRSGDNLKFLDRGASARLGRPVVRDFLASLDRPVLLLLDLELDDYPLKSRYELAETALEAAARGLYRTFIAQEKSGLIIRGLSSVGPLNFGLSWGREHTMTMLESLASCRSASGLPFWDQMQDWPENLSTGVTLAYLGPVPKTHTREFLYRLYKKGHRVEILIVSGNREEMGGPSGFHYSYISDDLDE